MWASQKPKRNYVQFYLQNLDRQSWSIVIVDCDAGLTVDLQRLIGGSVAKAKLACTEMAPNYRIRM